MSDLLARLRDADTTRRIGESYADTHERRQRDREEAADRIEQLEAEAKTRTLDYLGQVGQLSEEIERVKREAERAQDAHGVRFLNYLEETARLSDEIERLRAALEVCDRVLHFDLRGMITWGKDYNQAVKDAADAARAALEDRS